MSYATQRVHVLVVICRYPWIPNSANLALRSNNQNDCAWLVGDEHATHVRSAQLILRVFRLSMLSGEFLYPW